MEFSQSIPFSFCCYNSLFLYLLYLEL
jgi:hypothetical protein